jgi:hypothetical protein
MVGFVFAQSEFALLAAQSRVSLAKTVTSLKVIPKTKAIMVVFIFPPLGPSPVTKEIARCVPRRRLHLKMV